MLPKQLYHVRYSLKTVTLTKRQEGKLEVAQLNMIFNVVDRDGQNLTIRI